VDALVGGEQTPLPTMNIPIIPAMAPWMTE